MEKPKDDCGDRFETTCKREFAEIKCMIVKLDLAVRGDGDQRPGLAGRLAKVEGTVKGASRLMWAAVIAAITSVVGLAVAAVWAAVSRAN